MSKSQKTLEEVQQQAIILEENSKKLQIWQSAMEYGVAYENYLHGSIEVTSDKVNELRKVAIKVLALEIIEYIDLFCNLDKEYTSYVNMEDNNNKVSKRLIKDTTWKGFWLKATGFDCRLFLGWIKSAIKYDRYKDKDLVFWYMQEQEKALNQVPSSIKIANSIFQKYYR